MKNWLAALILLTATAGSAYDVIRTSRSFAPSACQVLFYFERIDSVAGIRYFGQRIMAVEDSLGGMTVDTVPWSAQIFPERTDSLLNCDVGQALTAELLVTPYRLIAGVLYPLETVLDSSMAAADSIWQSAR